MRRSAILVSMILLAAAVAAGPALADEPGPSAHLTFTLDGPTVAHSVPSVVELVASGDGAVVSVTTGTRLPIPTRSHSGDESADEGAVQFSYQQVGLAIHARTQAADDGRMRVAGTLEVSGLAAGFVPGDLEPPPVVSTSSCSFDVALADGETARIIRLAGADGDLLTVHLELAVLD